MSKLNYNLPRGVNPAKIEALRSDFPLDVRDLIKQGTNSVTAEQRATYRGLSVEALASEIVVLTAKLQAARLSYLSKYIERLRDIETNNIDAAMEYREKAKEIKRAKIREKAFARRKGVDGAIYRKFNLSPEEIFDMMAQEFLEKKDTQK